MSFDGQILPILQRGCSPCHFAGGSMHARLPFDREATIRELGTRLFTRIKDPAEQALIRRLISQPASEAAPEPRTKPPDPPGESPSPR